MKFLKVSLCCFLLLGLTGCVSTKSSDLMISEKIEGPRVIAVSGDRGPWVYEIEKRLKQEGFSIKRMASQKFAIEQVSSTKKEAYNEASARFVLLLNGYAINDSMNRCFGGGYKFEYIDVEMVDVRNNETVLHYSNSGYSEGCPPLSGTIFGDITSLVSSAWE